jgi:ubiquinone/menaquinone biosynthesis C-methylase UbiE
MNQTDQTWENQAALAFNGQSVYFDELYASNEIIRYKRRRVRDHLMNWLAPGSDILELNAGTGDDAVFLAQKGYKVHATDISEGMQMKLIDKVAFHSLSGLVSRELCSFTSLDLLEKRGPYDCIFSNFAGLNCTDKLGEVLSGFDPLLKPGGVVVLVILPGFCLWESLLVFRGKFKTATRRFFSAGGRKAFIDNSLFRCWYYSPRYVKRIMKEKYALLGLEGLCTIVPPSYLDNFPEKFPNVYSRLCKAENKLKNRWPWKLIGDYYIISFRKK